MKFARLPSFSNSSIRRYIMQKAISKYWPVFVLPTLVAFIIGFIWPFIWGTYLSFQRFTTVSKTTFVGIQNYLSVFQDSTFLHAFGFTAVFTVVSTVLINVFAFAIALVLTRGHQGHQPVPYRVLHAQPDRRHPAGLHLADPAQRPAGQPARSLCWPWTPRPVLSVWSS